MRRFGRNSFHLQCKYTHIVFVVHTSVDFVLAASCVYVLGEIHAVVQRRFAPSRSIAHTGAMMTGRRVRHPPISNVATPHARAKYRLVWGSLDVKRVSSSSSRKQCSVYGIPLGLIHQTQSCIVPTWPRDARPALVEGRVLSAGD